MDTITQFSNAALDTAYKKTAGAMLAQISALARSQNGRMQRQLKKLDEEAQRLKDEGKRMTTDNAVLLQTIDEYETLMTNSSDLIAANDNEIQNAGLIIAATAVSAKVFTSLAGEYMRGGKDPVSEQALKYYVREAAKRGIDWNTNLTMDIVTNYVDSPAWKKRLDKWGIGYADLTRESILNDIKNGASPIATASHMRQLAEGLPVSASETLTRTLQLTSYRDASLAMEAINGKYIEGKIRIATLDDKTCLSCVALHGTPLAVGERVDDHYNGRCTEFYQVVGGDQYPTMMQSDSIPGKRQFVPFQSGVDWFNSLSPERQARQASFMHNPAKLRAFRDGVPLTEFVGEHTDDVFGKQMVEKSLIDALGGDAPQYYEANQ